MLTLSRDFYSYLPIVKCNGMICVIDTVEKLRIQKLQAVVVVRLSFLLLSWAFLLFNLQSDYEYDPEIPVRDDDYIDMLRS